MKEMDQMGSKILPQDWEFLRGKDGGVCVCRQWHAVNEEGMCHTGRTSASHMLRPALDVTRTMP